MFPLPAGQPEDAAAASMAIEPSAAAGPLPISAKGKPPGAPPPTVKSATPHIEVPPGEGKGKGKGKGKGPVLAGLAKPPPPPAPPLHAKAKAPPLPKWLSALKSAPSTPAPKRPPPPPHLLAPSEAPLLRVGKVIDDTRGSLWSGLDPWGGSSDANPFGLAINHDRLRALWVPVEMPSAPSLPAEQVQREVLSANLRRSIEIAMQSLKLTPGLVQQALTEDLDLLTPDQARGLWELVGSRIYEEPHVTGELQGVVSRFGTGSLRQAEALVWTLVSVPNGCHRSNLAALRYSLPEDVKKAEHQAEAAESKVCELQQSLPLKTLLQSILVVRNILTQQECAAFSLESLGAFLAAERVRRNLPTMLNPVTGMMTPGGAGEEQMRQLCPSTLRLACEVFLDTHAYRCRLRFLRMMAVGRLVKSVGGKRLVWGFLDDLGESLMDVVPLLRNCSSGICDADILRDLARQQMSIRMKQSNITTVQTDIDSAINANLGTTSQNTGRVLSDQLAELNSQMAKAIACFKNSEERLVDSARRLRVLACGHVHKQTSAGSAAQQIRSMELATDTINDLRMLGIHVEKEVANILWTRARAKQQLLAASIRNTAGPVVRSVRPWPQVDTRHEALLSTSDTDLMRTIRGSYLAGDGDAGTAAPTDEDLPAEVEAKAKAEEAKAESKAKAKAQAAQQRAVDLSHGGPEGLYRRDPITGKWGLRLDGADGTVAQAHPSSQRDGSV